MSHIFQGGVNDNVTMTAYITASLLELETPVTVSSSSGNTL